MSPQSARATLPANPSATARPQQRIAQHDTAVMVDQKMPR